MNKFSECKHESIKLVVDNSNSRNEILIKLNCHINSYNFKKLDK